MSDNPNDENNPLNDAVENSDTSESNNDGGSSGNPNNQQSTTTSTAATGAEALDAQIAEAEQDLSGSNAEGGSADEDGASSAEEDSSPDAVQSSDAQSNVVDSQLDSGESSDGESAAGLSEEEIASALQAVGVQSVGGEDIAAALQNPNFVQAAQGIAQDLLDGNISPADALTQLEEALNDNDPDTETTTESFDVTVEEATDEATAEGEDFATETVSETFQMGVTNVNDGPEVGDAIALNMQEDGTLLITQEQLLANSSDIDGDDLTAQNLALTDSSQGTIVANDDGTFSFIPSQDFNGNIDFTFEVTDGQESVQSSLSVDVAAVNDAATSDDVDLVGTEDTAITITQADLLANAVDVDGDSLTASNLSIDSSFGTLTDNGDGTFNFTPSQDYNGDVPFSFDISDGTATTRAHGNLDVASVNDEPVLAETSFAITEDNSIVITEAELLSNTTDVDADSLSVSNISAADGNGSVTQNDDGDWVYTPNEHFSGEAHLTISINDGTVTADFNSVVTVDAEADAPSLNVSLQQMSVADFGDANIQGGVLQGWQTDNQSGGIEVHQDWVYGVGDDRGLVMELEAAVGDEANVYQNLDIEAGDTIELSFDISARVGSAGADSQVDVYFEGQLIDSILPDVGWESHTYTLTATTDNPRLELDSPSHNGGGAVLDVIRISEPSATQEETAIGLDIDAALVDTDGSESMQSIEVDAIPEGAILTDGTNTFTATADNDSVDVLGWDMSSITITTPENFAGDVTLQVTATSEEGANGDTASTTSDLTFTVEDVNDAVVIDANNVPEFNATEDTAFTITEAALLANASDVDSDELIVTNLQIPNATFNTVVDPDTGDKSFVVTPDENFNGDVDISFSVSDQEGSVVQSGASLTVAAVNDAAVGGEPTISGQEDTTLYFSEADLLQGATDVEGDELSVQNVAYAGDDGTLSESGNIAFGDGTNGQVRLDETLESFDEFTIDFTYTSTGSHTGGIENLFGNATSDAGNNMLNVYVRNSDGGLGLDVANTDSSMFSGLNLNDGQPHHISISWSAEDGVLKVFDDGQLVGTDTLQAGATIPSGGLAILGQEQDTYGGGFDSTQAVSNLELSNFSMAYERIDDAHLQAETDLASVSNNMAFDLRVENGEVVDTTGQSGVTVSGDVDTTLLYKFEPNENFNGEVELSYDISDGTDITSTSATLDLQAINDAAVVEGLSLSMDEDGTITITDDQLLAGASDVDGDSLSVDSVSYDGSDGTLTDNGDGTYTFAPSENFNGDLNLSFGISDGTAVTDASIDLTVASINDGPVAQDDGNVGSLVLDGDDSLTLGIGNNDIHGQVTSMWFKIPEDADGPQGLFGIIDPGNGNDRDLYLNEDGDLVAYTWDSSGQNDYTTTDMGDLADGEWHHVVYSLGNGGNQIYIDGELAASGDLGQSDFNWSSAMTIGTSHMAGDMTGEIRDFQTYTNISADQDDVDALYAGNTLETTQGVEPQFRMQFEEGAEFEVTGSNAQYINNVAVITGNPEVTQSLEGSTVAADNVITNFDVLANDSDVEGAISITGLSDVVDPDGTVIGTLNIVDVDGVQQVQFMPDSDVLALSAGERVQGQFSYTVEDEDGATDTANVVFQFAGTNTTPEVTQNLAVSVDEDGSITLTQADLLTHAVDTDGDSLTADNLAITGDATLTDNGDGTFTIRPDANFNGDIGITFDVTDGDRIVEGGADLTVNAVNDLPITSDVSATTAEDTAITVTQAELLANASDIDGGPLTAENLTANNAMITDNGDGTFSILPDPNFNGDIEVSYDINDGAGITQGTLNLDVTAVNDTATTSDVGLSGTEDTTVTITQADLLANAADVDGDALTAVNLTIDESFGTLTDNGDGSWSFEPAQDFNGSVPMSYQIDDGTVQTPATGNINLAAVNDLPTLDSEVSFTATEDEGLVINAADILANASDVDGDTLSVTDISSTDGNTTVINNNDGTFTIFGDDNFAGTDNLEITISDGTDTATFSSSVEVAGTADEPFLALNLDTTPTHTFTVTESGWQNPAVWGWSTDNTGGYGGSGFANLVEVNHASGTYGVTGATEGTVLELEGYGNDAGNLWKDLDISAGETFTIEFDISGRNNLDPQSNHVKLYFEGEEIDQLIPEVGFETVSYTLTATEDNPRFEFEAAFNDGAGALLDRVTVTKAELSADEDNAVAIDISAALADTDGSETLDVEISGLLEDAVLSDGTNTFTATADDNSVDVTGWDLSNLSMTPPANFNGDASLTATATATEATGDSASSTIDIPITINAVNDEVQIGDNITATVDEDGSFTLTQEELLANASDLDGDDLTAQNLQSDNATITDNGDGTFTVAPDANFNGDLDVSFDVTDGNGSTVQSNVDVTVNAVNDAAVGGEPTIEGLEDRVIRISEDQLLEGASDVDGDALSVQNVSYSGSDGVLREGNSIEFGDGKDGNIEIENIQQIDAFSFEIDLTSLQTDNSDAIDNIIGMSAPGVQNALNIWVPEDGNGLLMDINGTQYGPIATDVNYQDGDQHIITLTWDGATGETNVYENGALIDTATIAPGSSINAGGIMTIGQEQDTFGGGFADFQATSEMSFGHMSFATEVISAEDVADGSLADSGANMMFDIRVDNGEIVDTTGNQSLTVEGDVSISSGWEFIPNDDFTGDVTLDYEIFDGTEATATTATINVADVNDAAVASDNTLTATEDTAYQLSAADFPVTDVDGDSYTVTIDSIDGEGSLILGATDVPESDFVLDTGTNSSAEGVTVSSNAEGEDVYNFDSASDVIDLNSTLDIGQTWTISVDFQNPKLNDGAWSTLTRGSQEDGGNHHVLLHHSTNELGVYSNDDATFFGSGYYFTADENDGAFHNLTAVGEGGETHFYVDGEFVGSSAHQVTVPISDVGNFDGNDDGIGDGQPFAGAISNFEVFDEALSANQVSTHVNGPQEVQAGDSLTVEQLDNLSFVPDADANGEGLVDIQFHAVDENGLAGDPATLSFDVTAVNDAADVSGLAATINEDGTFTFSNDDLLATASDVDGDTLAVDSVSYSGTDGVFADNGDGTYSFAPNENFNGEISFEYGISDGSEVSVANVDLTVDAINDAPLAGSTSFSMDEDGVITISNDQLLANSSDVEGDTLTVTNVDYSGDDGALVNNGDGTYTFTPNANFNGDVSFSVTVSDGTDVSNTTADIDVASVNDLPSFPDPTYTMDEDTTIVLTADDIISQATDLDGDTLTLDSVTYTGDDGVLVDNGDDTYSFTPSANFNGDIDLTATVNDGTATVDATVHLQVDAVNDAATSDDVDLMGTEDTTITITQADLLANASDIDGDSLTASNLTIDPSFGAVTDNGDGTFDFAPSGDYNGDVPFSFTLSDGTATTNVHGNIDVAAVNDTPVLAETSFALTEDNSIVITEAELLANASDIDGDALSVTNISTQDGSVTQNDDGDWVYTPTENYSGDASLTITLSDGTTTADFTSPVTIDAEADAPSLNVSLQQMSVADFGDANIQGGVLQGWQTDNQSGGIEVHQDTVYGVGDDRGLVMELEAAVGDEGNVYQNLDIEAGDTIELSFDISARAAHGGANSQVDLYFEGQLIDSILPDVGWESHTYTLTATTDNPRLELDAPGTDGGGAVLDVIRISEPTATQEETAIGLDIDAALVDTDGSESMQSIQVDAIPEGAILTDGTNTFTATADNDSVDVLGWDMSSITITTPENFAGDVTLQVTATSEEGANGDTASTTSDLTFTVEDVNDAVVIDADNAPEFNATEDTAFTITEAALLANASDVDSDELIVTNLQIPNATFNTVVDPDTGDKSFVVTPDENFNGDVDISFSVSDQEGSVVQSGASLTVAAVNDGPVAVDDTAATDEDTAILIDVLANDSDIEGDVSIQSVDEVVMLDGVQVGTAEIVDIPVMGQVELNPSDATATSNLYGNQLLDDDSWSAGNGININGVNYDSGIGMHPGDGLSTATFDIPEGATNFSSILGMTSSGLVNVSVRVDGVSLFDQANVTANSDGGLVDIDVTGGSTLTLLVHSNGTKDNDHFVWAQPEFTAPTGEVNQQIQFTPNENFEALSAGEQTDVSIDYVIVDSEGATDTASINVTVTGLNNEVEVSGNVSASVDEDGTLTLTQEDLLANATDVDGDDLTASNLSVGGNATVVDNGDGTFTVTPDANFNGELDISFDVTDGNGSTVSSNVDVTVNAVNDGPVVANAVAVSQNEEESVVVDPAQLIGILPVSDVDGDTLTITEMRYEGSDGTFVENDDGTYTITGNEDFVGIMPVTYVVEDGNGGSAEGTINVEVVNVNDLPTAGDPLTATIQEDGSYTFTASDLLVNAADVDGDVISLASVSLTDSSQGSIVTNDDGSYTFTPNENFNGDVQIDYTISDGIGDPVANTLDVTVEAVNDAAVVDDASFSVNEDGSLTITDAQLLANASDIDGDTLSIDNVTYTGTDGILTNNGDGTHTFAPNENFNGEIGSGELTYGVSDGTEVTTADIAITVDAVNDNPIVSGDLAYSVDEDGSITFSQAQLLANTSDVEGDALTAELTSAANATITDNGDGTYTVSPDANFNGDIDISFNISDADGTTSSNIDLTVNPVNDAPIVAGGVDVSEDFSNPDSAWVAAGDAAIADGDATLTEDVNQQAGAILYDQSMPSDQGIEVSFTMTNQSSSDNGDGMGFALVNGNNIDASNFEAGNAGGNMGIAGMDGLELGIGFSEWWGDKIQIWGDGNSPVATIDISDNSIDNQSIPVNINISPEGILNVEMSYDGGTTFTPVVENFNLADNAINLPSDVKVAFAGGTGGSTAEHSIDDISIMAAGGAASSSTIDEDTSITITQEMLLENASDIEGDALTASGLAVAEGQGSVVDNGDGTFTVTPDADFNGSLELSYSVSDGTDSTDATYAVNVDNVNDAAQTGSVSPLTMDEDGSMEIDPDYILGFASDVDGDDLSLTSLTLRDPNQGTLTQNAQTGVYSFSPAANFAGAVALDYVINDGTEDTAGSMEVNVTPVNDAAFVDGNSQATVMEDGQITFNADDLLNLFGDVDGDNLTISNVITADGEEAEGEVVDNGDGTFTFTPEDDFAGTTQLQVIVSDGTVETAMDMPVYVRPVADGAVITKSQDGPIVMNEDETGFLSLSVDLLDASESLTSLVMTGYPVGFTISDGEHSVTITEEGQLILINDWDISNISMDPPANWHGTFEVTVTATTVDYGEQDANALPDSSDITGDFDAIEGQDLIITELDLLDMAENTQVQDGDEVGLVHLIDNSQGTLVDNGDGTWTFSPADGFTGEVDFAYVIQRDGELFDEQSSIGVQPAVPGANNGPEIDGIATTDIDKGNSVEFTDADLLAQISDADGDDLSITGVQITDGGGVLEQASDGTYTYTPDPEFSGEAQISFVASDGIDSVTSFVNVNVINAAPEVVAADQASGFTVDEDGSITLTEAELLTAAGASDADGDTMSVEGLGVQPDSGTVINNGDGSWTVWPDPDFSGDMQLTFMVNDGTDSTPATVPLTVTPENDAPTESAPLDVEMDVNGTTTLTLDELLANVTDVDGDNLSVSNFQSDNATVTDNGDDTYSIVADGDFQGTADITFDVSDGTETVQASISANVSPAEDGQVDGEAADYTAAPGASLNISIPDSISGDSSVDHVIVSDLPEGATVTNGLEDNDGNYVISGDLSQPIQVSLGDNFEGDVSLNLTGYDALDQAVDGASETIGVEVDDAYAMQGSSADGANVDAGGDDQSAGDWTNADNTNTGVDVMDDSSSFDNANDNSGSNDDMSDLGGIG